MSDTILKVDHAKTIPIQFGYLGTLSIVDYSALLVFYLIFQAQIHLIGNPMIWYLGTLSVVGYSALLVFYLIFQAQIHLPFFFGI
jgi:hypothetical protein